MTRLLFLALVLAFGLVAGCSRSPERQPQSATPAVSGSTALLSLAAVELHGPAFKNWLATFTLYQVRPDSKDCSPLEGRVNFPSVAKYAISADGKLLTVTNPIPNPVFTVLFANGLQACRDAIRKLGEANGVFVDGQRLQVTNLVSAERTPDPSFAQDSSKSEQPSSGWFGMDVNKRRCFPVPSPAERMREIQREGKYPRVTDLDSGAVEIGVETPRGLEYWTTFRTLDSCIAALPASGAIDKRYE